MKLVKKLFIALAILVVILVIGSFAASRFLTKSLIEEQLSSATGRQLKIAGDLKPIFSLTPSLRAENVTFANASWGSRPELAKIGKFDIQLQLLPLLSGKIIVNKLDLDKADILLEKKADKWNFSLSDTQKAKENKDQKEATQPKKKEMQFDISSLAITDSILTMKQSGEPTIINIKSLKFAPRKDKMGLDFDGVAAGKPIKLSVDMPPVMELMNAKKFELANISFASGDIKLSGNGTIDMGGKKPFVKGSFKADSIDLSSQGASADAAPNAKAKPQGAMFSDAPLPFDAFDSFDGDLKINIGKLKSGNAVVENISAPLQVRSGVLNINPLKAGFAGGQISSNLALAKSGSSVVVKGDNLLMEKILAQVAEINDFKDGVTNIDVNVRGSGNSIAKIVGSLNGYSNIYMKPGEYKGRINTGSVTELAQLLTGGGTSSTTEINCVLANINWSGGLGSVQSMAVDTKYAYLLGGGSLRLYPDNLNLILTPKAKSPGLASLAIPVAVKGSFNHLSYYPEPIGAVQNLAGNAFKGVLGAALSGGDLKTGLKSGLKNVLNEDAGKSPCANPVEGAKQVESETGKQTLSEQMKVGAQQPAANAPSDNANKTPEQRLNDELTKKLNKIF